MQPTLSGYQFFVEDLVVNKGDERKWYIYATDINKTSFIFLPKKGHDLPKKWP